METPTYKRQDMLPISRIQRMIPGRDGGPCSRQHVHNLIDNGKLHPAFQIGSQKFVPVQVVNAYLSACRIDVGA